MSEVEFTILDNSNIVESYPGVTLPLTYSFIKIAYKGIFKGLIGESVNTTTKQNKAGHPHKTVIK
jgi:hypothetical protein